MLDYLIKNARIADGTGAPIYQGAVGVSGDKITAVIPEGVDDGFCFGHQSTDCGILRKTVDRGKANQVCTAFPGKVCDSLFHRFFPPVRC